MTDLLERAVARARALPPDQQDTLATLLLDEMGAEAGWQRRLDASPDLLARLADEALADLAAGRASDGDPSDRG
jgi:hypothetical protein